MQETNDQGPAVARALLTAELRSLRDRSGLRQQDIARKLDWDQSKIIRIENGKSAITKTDLAAMLSRYGVEDRERVRELTDLARTAHRKGWWENFADAPVSKEFLSFLGYEHGAPAIRVCDPLQVPGLLQTPAYTAATLQAFRKALPDDARKTAALFRERQLQAAGRRPRQEYIIDGALLVRALRDPGVMPAQLRCIAAAARQPGITVRVVPSRHGLHYGGMGSFTLLDFGNPLGTMLYTGTWRHGSVLVGEQNLPGVASDPSAVAEYSAEYDHLARCSALSPDESARFIEEAAVRHARAGAVGEALSLARRPSGPEPGDLEPGA